MNKLQCRVCGGQIELQEDNRGICLNCGTAYSLGSMRKMFEGLKVSVTGSSEDVEQWRLLLDKYYSVGDFTGAERVAKKILEANPSDEQTNLRYDELQVLKYFDVKNGVIKGYTGTARKIKIPNVITEIEAHTFTNNQYIEEVWLPDTIKIIEDGLFSNCSNLKYVHLPDNLEVISSCAFWGCSALEKMEIPESVSEIGQAAFYECQGLSSIDIKNRVENIGNRAFYGCIQLTSFRIPSGITEISDSTFEGCSKLNDVEIPATVKSIRERAFKNCISLREIVIPASVTELGSLTKWKPNGVFEGCTSLVRVDLNQGLETIGDFTFSGCHSLTSIEIPFGVRSIGCGAFRGCESLSQISIPSSVLSIETHRGSGSDCITCPPFEDCDNLKHIDYPDRFDDWVFSGSKFYAIREERKKSGLCPKCGGKLSFWNGRCSRCG